LILRKGMASFFVGIAASNRYDGGLFHHKYQSIAMERIIIYLPVGLHQVQSNLPCYLVILLHAERAYLTIVGRGNSLSLSLTLTSRLLFARPPKCDSASHDPPTLANTTSTTRYPPLLRSPLLLETELIVTHGVTRVLECIRTSRHMRCSGNLALCRFAAFRE
jgi:hypothetical protein